jgi:hypothetical protein
MSLRPIHSQDALKFIHDDLIVDELCEVQIKVCRDSFASEKWRSREWVLIYMGTKALRRCSKTRNHSVIHNREHGGLLAAFEQSNQELASKHEDCKTDIGLVHKATTVERFMFNL